jgi:hypothetical protein
MDKYNLSSHLHPPLGIDTKLTTLKVPGSGTKEGWRSMVASLTDSQPEYLPSSPAPPNTNDSLSFRVSV